jgi:cysteine desulfurase/selenocysteine lyase
MTSLAGTGVFDVRAVRADFPILDERIGDAPLVYLDSAATSQKPRVVLDAERAFLEHANAAVHRGAHTLAAEATESFEDARAAVAAFVGAEPESIVWTAGATAALNLAAFAIGNASVGPAAASHYALHPGDEIVVTEAEHHANLIPWQQLAARTGAVLRHIPVHDDGTLDLTAAAALIGGRTRVVAFSHVSNVLGIVNPVAELVALARDAGALTVLDACQSAPHVPLDLPALGVDLAAFSGHKVLGPYGIGVLYGRAEVLEALPPVLTGGSMVTTVTLDDAEFLPAPHKFEAGTQPVSQAIGLAAAVRNLEGLGRTPVHQRERHLERRQRDGLRAIDGVHAHDVGQVLDAHGIAVRVGHHCAQPLHRRFGMTASVRASASVFTTEDEIDAFLDALSGVRAYFGVGR